MGPGEDEMARGQNGPGVIPGLSVNEPGPIPPVMVGPLRLALVVREVQLVIVAVGSASVQDLTVLGDQLLRRWPDRVRLVAPEQSDQVEHLAVRQDSRHPWVPPVRPAPPKKINK